MLPPARFFGRARKARRPAQPFRVRPTVELLEDRTVMDNGRWYTVLTGLPYAESLEEQAQLGRNLLHSVGLQDQQVSVVDALDLSGTLFLQTPLDTTQESLSALLSSVPGFICVADYTPVVEGPPSTDIPGPLLRGPYEALYGPFDYDAFLERELNGEVPDSSGTVESEALDSLANNETGTPSTQAFTQSETTIVAFGNTVVVGFNDSGSTAGGANKFTGWAYSTDGGDTFTDGGTLPTSTGGDAGDPVMARNDSTGRIYYSTLGFSVSTIQMFRSDDNGQTWLAPVNATPGGSSEDKQWHTVDNFSGTGNGNVYLLSRRFGASPGIYFFRSTDNGATFGPNGGTFIVSGQQGAFIAVAPNHDIYAFWYNGTTLQMRKSTNQGTSFGTAVTVASGLVGGVNGDLGLTGIRQGTSTPSGFRSNEFPHVAVNPSSGHIYVTFADNPTGTDKGDIYMVTSTDGGATWSSRTKINDDTTTTDQWMPTIAVTPDGSKLGIFYSSRQEDPTNNNLFKHYGRIGSISGSTVTFSTSFAVSDTASLPEFGRDSLINSVYMGDYNHAAATAGAFHVVWGDNRDNLPPGPPNQQRKDPDVFYKKISLGLAVTSTVPAVGSTVATVPVDYVVNFSDPINTSTVQATDFTVTNDSGTPVAANSFVINGAATQVTFTYTTAPFSNQGPHTMAMAAGSILRASDSSPLAAFSGSFTFALPAPEIQVLDGATDIPDNTGSVNYGSTVVGTPVSRTFTVRNVGTTTLTLSTPITVPPSGFTLTASFGSTSLAPNASTTFTVRLDATAAGSFSGQVSFGNNDANENPFNFTISGTVNAAPVVQIIDNGATGFATVGDDWINHIGLGFQNDIHYSSAGTGSDMATWNFTVTPGIYRVSATWVAQSNLATNAPYRINGGSAILINQQQAPNDFNDQGVPWENLGSTHSVSGTSLTVLLTDAANDYVFADAIRIEFISGLPSGPEIQVLDGATDIPDNTGSVSYGSTQVGTPVSRTFTVRNVGTTTLTLTPPITAPTGFTVTSSFGSTSLAPNASTTFTVRLDATATGTFSGQVSFGNNDADENPFNFTVSGTVTPATTVQIIDNGATGYVESGGDWINHQGLGFQGDISYSSAGTGSDTATWTFIVTPGIYRVSATWVAQDNLATNAGYRVNGGALITINQQLAPNDFNDQGAAWEDLGTTHSVSGTSLTVLLTDNANNYVFADAIRIERIA